jgi:hypothetical protein
MYEEDDIPVVDEQIEIFKKFNTWINSLEKDGYVGKIEIDNGEIEKIVIGNDETEKHVDIDYSYDSEKFFVHFFSHNENGTETEKRKSYQNFTMLQKEVLDFLKSTKLKENIKIMKNNINEKAEKQSKTPHDLDEMIRKIASNLKKLYDDIKGISTFNKEARSVNDIYQKIAAVPSFQQIYRERTRETKVGKVNEVEGRKVIAQTTNPERMKLASDIAKKEGSDLIVADENVNESLSKWGAYGKIITEFSNFGKISNMVTNNGESTFKVKMTNERKLNGVKQILNKTNAKYFVNESNRREMIVVFPK